MAAPEGLVRDRPSSTRACRLLEYSLRLPSEAVPESRYFTVSSKSRLSTVTWLPLTFTMPFASPETVAPLASENTMEMVRANTSSAMSLSSWAMMSMTRPVMFSSARMSRSSRRCSSGCSGVRFSKRILLLQTSGGSPLILSSLTMAK